MTAKGPSSGVLRDIKQALRPFIKDDEVKYYLNIKFHFVLIFTPEM
jgi:hypothetical protein